MSSGCLPLSNYHRAEFLGCGSYGSVLTVYDDDGDKFALKLFTDDDSEEGEDSSSEDTSSSSFDKDDFMTLDLSALREISILRLLRDKNTHQNIINIHDVSMADTCEEEESGGAGTNGYMGIAMPLFSHGTLSNAIDSKQLTNKQCKVQIAHGILNAVAFLHHNGIIHRDIKGDNIMLRLEEKRSQNTTEYSYKPLLIDFSLAKIIDARPIYNFSSLNGEVEKLLDFTISTEGEDTHTPTVGTPTYKAPEVVNNEPYGLPSDLYSVGVILLELLRGRTLEAVKDKGAARIISEAVCALPALPFANLVRGLLNFDPSKRWSAKQALECKLFHKFALAKDKQMEGETFRLINIREALPLEEHGRESNHETEKSAMKNGRKYIDPVLFSRYRKILKIAHELESNHPLIVQAALTYSIQLSQLDDSIDNLKESQALIDCVILAHKFFEREMWCFRNLQKRDKGVFKECNWTISNYQENESSIWLLMDFCLYPRKLVEYVNGSKK